MTFKWSYIVLNISRTTRKLDLYNYNVCLHTTEWISQKQIGTLPFSCPSLNLCLWPWFCIQFPVPTVLLSCLWVLKSFQRSWTVIDKRDKIFIVKFYTSELGKENSWTDVKVFKNVFIVIFIESNVFITAIS